MAGWTEQDLSRYFSGIECWDGQLRIDAVEPGRDYRIWLFSEDANAGIVTTITPGTTGEPIDIKLLP